MNEAIRAGFNILVIIPTKPHHNVVFSLDWIPLIWFFSPTFVKYFLSACLCFAKDDQVISSVKNISFPLYLC